MFSFRALAKCLSTEAQDIIDAFSNATSRVRTPCSFVSVSISCCNIFQPVVGYVGFLPGVRESPIRNHRRVHIYGVVQFTGGNFKSFNFEMKFLPENWIPKRTSSGRERGSIQQRLPPNWRPRTRCLCPWRSWRSRLRPSLCPKSSSPSSTSHPCPLSHHSRQQALRGLNCLLCS